MLAALLIRLAETLPIVDWTTRGMLSRPTIVSFVPDEPTTWTLAIIGALALGAYALLSRYLRAASTSSQVEIVQTKQAHSKKRGKHTPQKRKRKAA